MSATRRLVDKMTAMYYRLDREGAGRNAESTYRTLSMRWDQLQAALAAGGYEELDSNERLAAKYSRLERRHKTGVTS